MADPGWVQIPNQSGRAPVRELDIRREDSIMINKQKLAAIAAATGLTVGGLLAGSAPADAAPPHRPTAVQRVATASPDIPWFGQSYSVDGYQIWATVERAGRENRREGFPGHLSETVHVYVTRTVHHKKWKGHFGQSARYGKDLARRAINDGGEGFPKPTSKFPTVMSWTRYRVGKHHYPKHFEYTFHFKGHALRWSTQ